ncbi:MAG: hypothetical protein QXE66_03515 [Desulfurococcaceae archaeon]
MNLKNGEFLLILATAIVMTLAVFPVVNAENFVFKPGDWITYRYSITGNLMDVNVNCSFKIKVEILGIEDTTITYRFSLSEVETADQICQSIGQGVGSSTRSVNTAKSTPESMEIFIDPSYSGKYNISYGKVEYYRGVLKSVEGESYGAQIKISIIDSSIAELSPSGSLTYLLLIVLAVMGILVAVVATAVFILVRKIKKAHAPSLPSPPPLTAPL